MDVIFDIDGTLADCTHRRHYVVSHPKNWKAFFATVEHDTLIKPVAQLLRALLSSGHKVICCSGRPEDIRNATEQWLYSHGLFPHRLYMRKTDDYRPDDIIKAELLEDIRADGFNPILAVEDRSRIVKVWRYHGLTCLQCAEGDL